MEFLVIGGIVVVVLLLIAYIVGGVVGTYEEVSGDAHLRREDHKTNGSNYVE